MKKILKFIGKYKIFLVLSVLLATVSVILQLYVPILFGDAIDQIVAEHQVQFDTMWVLLREILGKHKNQNYNNRYNSGKQLGKSK